MRARTSSGPYVGVVVSGRAMVRSWVLQTFYACAGGPVMVAPFDVAIAENWYTRAYVVIVHRR